jgi:hypothetical protein
MLKWLFRLRLNWLTSQALREIARRKGVSVSSLYTVIPLLRRHQGHEP